MDVNIKFRTGDILKGIRNGSYSVPDGCTVQEAMDCAIVENSLVLSDHDREYLFALANNRQAKWDDLLNDGDSLWILFKILGG